MILTLFALSLPLIFRIITVRDVARALFVCVCVGGGGGGVYSYIRVILPDKLLSKSAVFEKKLVGQSLNV